MQIFCDESGFTGNHLLDKQQQIFAYATVAVDGSSARQLVESVRKNHRLEGKELKGSDLLKQQRGRHAVEEILHALQGNFRVAIHLKPYALAGKLFEYIFEPAFSECNSIFYEIDFHRFISTLLFAFFRASDIDTVKFLEDFSSFARKGEVEALKAMFPVDHLIGYTNNPLRAIGLFAEVHREKIAEEVLGFRQPGVPNWLLDLTSTSLFHLLASWGQTYSELEVTCDEAKPLAGDLPLFDAMIGRTEKKTITFQGEDHPLLFNLSRKLQFGSSVDVPGLQLADCVASAAGMAWRDLYNSGESKGALRWRELILPGVAADSIWPDLKNADLQNASTFANSIVLQELVERSIKKQNLCDGMFDIYRNAVALHPRWLLESSKIATS